MKNAELDSWLAEKLFRRLRSLEMLPATGSWEDIEQLRKQAGVIHKFGGWWDECMRIFAAAGCLERDGARVRIAVVDTEQREEPHELTLAEQIEQLRQSMKAEQRPAALEMVGPCLEHLPEVLRGTSRWTDILFRDSSFQEAQNLYQRNEQFDYFNTLVANVAKAYIQQQNALRRAEKVRIIEIGAGTGGTTAMVLPALLPLAGSIGEYCFTDISRAFLQHGEDQYKERYPFFKSALWNIEKPLHSQTIAPGAYDLAIATNVLHATKDIRQTLRNTKAALKPGGIFIINEIVGKSTLATLIFGLLDGWWSFEDREVRIPGSPLLDRARWMAVLEDEGFTVMRVPEKPIEGKAQQVFVAQSDGIVRREVSRKSASDEGQRVSLEVTGRSKAQERESSDSPAEGSRGSRESFVKDLLVGALSDGLRVPRASIENDIPFADYGVDSILGVAFVKQIKTALGIELNTAIIFDYTNVEQLVAYILGAHKDQITAAMQRVASEADAFKKETSSVKKVAKNLPPRGRPAPPKSATVGSRSLRQNDDRRCKDIAIIGMSGQFPGAKDVHELWENLIQGRDGVGELPAVYLDQEKYFRPAVKEEGKTYCKWGGILPERDCFEPLFFNISPREAESMNPHQRLVLQEGWKSLQDAGYDPKTLANSRVGVFIGAEPFDYDGASFTGSSEAIIASRLSYVLNLKGPAYVVNTGCSSSASAIHLACESLRREECNLAVAGGVFALLDARGLVTLSAIEMLSISGRCRTFDASCDGTVISEGVGIVVLKRLEEAVADGDSIYGVIKASGVNQDGASNGITAPSGLAQEQLITQLYRDYQINPEEISYVEAHGTGTPLGDPVEANALIRAFKQFTTKKSYCVLGSAKSNIGHAAAAAGVIGLIKVLLSFRHRQLPGLLHFKRLNPLIDLEESPFIIATEATAWQAEKGKPLVAALNSFGHSGTNVHLVIAQYIDEQAGGRGVTEADGPVLVPLSAKSEERLRVYANDLLLFLDRTSATASNDGTLLRNLAYTLQVGREAMSERVVFLVKSIDELREALTAFAQGTERTNTWKSQPVGKNNFPATLDEDIQGLVNKWFAAGKYAKIAELWVNKGCHVDWRQLYADRKARRISLPPYPFAKERYWIKSAQAAVESHTRDASRLHPLVHQNISSAFELRFVSCFTADEPFLSDQLLQGSKVLPSVVHLGMTSIALRQVFGLSLPPESLTSDDVVIELQDVVWLQPAVVVGEDLSVHISVVPTSETEANFDVFGVDANGEEILYSQARGRLLDRAQPVVVDLAHLRVLCADQSQRSQVLATLQMPSTAGEFGLHPGMLDGALQAAIGLSLGQGGGSTGTPLPFALSSITLYRGLPAKAYAWVRFSEGSGPGEAVQKLDITVCDEQGVVCADLEGLSSRVLQVEGSTMLWQPQWQAAPIESVGASTPITEQRVFLVGGFSEQAQSALQSVLPERVACHRLGVTEDSHRLGGVGGSLSARYAQAAEQLFTQIQQILTDRLRELLLVQVIVHPEEGCFAGLSGLLKTASQENPKLLTQCIELTEDLDAGRLSEIIQQDARDVGSQQIRYRHGEREVRVLQEVPAAPVGAEGEAPPWKDHGVYLITGGLGGLGLIFARDIAAHARGATVILTGRSTVDEKKQAQLDQLLAQGLRVDYQRVDVANRESVESLFAHIKSAYGGLTGILHSAGVIQDNFILKKSVAELQQVLSPKVAGLQNLDEASQDLALEQFICFSSVAGVLGNPGQADYAAGNAFMDAYAQYRNRLVREGRRHGQSLSIAWPLWAEGGMQVDAAVQTQLRRRGFSTLSTEAGLKAFAQCLGSNRDQVVVLSGDQGRLRTSLMALPESATATPLPRSAAVNIDTEALLGKVQQLLKQEVSAQLRIHLEDLDLDTELSAYGFDSISLTEWCNRLNERLHTSLTPAIFFEYSTLGAFAGYLVNEHGARLAEILNLRSPTRAASVPVVTNKTPALTLNSGVTRRRKGVKSVTDSPPASRDTRREAIAIIGMSGCFPQAPDIGKFWDDLKAGRDCITEIPPDRWDWRAVYGDPQTEVNRTNVKWGGFIDGVAEFDPIFFNISPKEAQSMDPQQRLVMTHTWQAIEDAGYAPATLSGTDTAIFIGTAPSGYGNLLAQARHAIEADTATGMASSMVPNRMSYLLDLHGPSEPIDTACSSSLVAIHRAVELLRQGRAGLAIAGGVNALITPDLYIALSKAGALSEGGRCRAFSDRANGYVRGEGVGILVLKLLSKAEQDHDHIYGVILGSAENHGGRANSVTAPNSKAQAELLKAAYRDAGIDPRTVTYIEAHGTGTELGDPVEINGLKSAFSELYAAHASRLADTHCGLGSVKTNIGHLELAAGVAGVIKVLLQLKHKTLVKSLHGETLNPYIDFRDSPFYVVQREQAWEALEDDSGRTIPRRAGVSSFGLGGVNAHVVLEEYVPAAPPPPVAGADRQPVLIVLSAKTEEQLTQQARKLYDYIATRQFTEADLADIAYTLQVGRDALAHRAATVVSSLESLVSRLKSFSDGTPDLQGSEDGAWSRGSTRKDKDTFAVFAADEDLREALDRWIEKGKYEKLSELWVKGLAFDWHRLYADLQPRRISLPTYPFAKERYWITDHRGDQPRAVERAERFLTKGWEISQALSTQSTRGTAVILCSDETRVLAEQILKRLPASQIVIVEPQRSATAATINRANFAGWIDIVGCGRSLDHETRWIALLQRYIDEGPATDIRLLCVTQGLEAYQNNSINLSGADRVGLYRMLSSEYARIQSSHVDLDRLSDAQSAVDQIIAEFSQFQTTNAAVELCYRRGQRYRAVLEEVPPGGEYLHSPGAPNFPSEHVLWITGGTRGIGSACAEHFVCHHGVKKVVLTGREKFPPRQLWGSIQNESSAMARKIRAILALESRGARVQALSVDLTDPAALQASIEEIRSTLGPIGGVLHCAGIIDGETPAFVRKSAGSIGAVLAPKVVALDNLLKGFADDVLRFFCLFSSVSATVPSLAVGQSDYAQANSYMDYVASAHSSQLPIMSIQWPSWKEIGMGESRSSIYRRLGFFSHTTAEGLRLLDRLLSRGREMGSVVLPAIVNTQYWQPGQLLEARPDVAAEIPQTPNVSKGAAESKTEPAVGSIQAPNRDSLDAIQKWLTQLVGRELKLPPSRIDIGTPLPEYGADSIMFAQISRAISREVGEALEPSVLFEYPTLEALSKWLAGRYGEVLGAGRDAVHGNDAVNDHHATAEAEAPPAHVLAPKVEQNRSAPAGDIAVVGLSCRFPRAGTVEEFWQLLSEGRSAIRLVPAERWGHSSNDYACVLDGASYFDPEFFSISQEDAQAMDPQALLALEEALALWYQAGYTVNEIKGREIGVYLGARSQPSADVEALNKAQNLIMAVGANYLAANISRFFDLRGPSIVIDTACSSALVAMNTAIQALQTGEIESALVGGVSLLNSDWALRTFERRGILSRAGEFHLFDRRASGTIVSEGAGMVWLKKVERALRDGDTIYGVVKAVAINNDGRTAGPSAPNIQAQKAVMTRALEKCGKQPDEVGYIEVNGSGTELMDLLELKAMESVYRSSTQAPCELGSMKPNIGHPLCAEGIASFIKCVLMLHHRRRVPFLSAREPMEHYDLAASPFYFSRALSDAGAGHGTIAINCFADGGTNAHVIVDAWTAQRSQAGLRRPLQAPGLRKIQCNRLSRSSQVAEAHCVDKSDPRVVAADFWRLDGGNESAGEVVDVNFWGLDHEFPQQQDA